jgi:hypothetical protein
MALADEPSAAKHPLGGSLPAHKKMSGFGPWELSVVSAGGSYNDR